MSTRLPGISTASSWTAREVRLPEDPRAQWWSESDAKNPLPKDGLPRITREGIIILYEGLKGDFRRWRQGIGNHPLEMPLEHIRNITIHAEKNRPHFVARVWYGDFPVVKYRVLAPLVPFDTMDTGVTQYTPEDPETITLGSSDCWLRIPVAVDDNLLWDRTALKTDEADEDEPEDHCRANKPRNGTLDAWMGGTD